MSMPEVKPYAGCEGYWTEAGKFRGKKSFGYFCCNYCEKTWMSAHAMKGYRQGCKECDREFMPKYLWVNTTSKSENERGLGGKPHLKSLCQACKKGVCTGSSTGSSYSGSIFSRISRYRY